MRKNSLPDFITSSAPSMARSSLDSRSRSLIGIFSSVACLVVFSEVETPTMLLSSEEASFAPRRSIANFMVEPVPMPSFMPLFT